MKVVRCHMNCFVLRTFTILSTLRFGRGGFQGLSSTYEQAHVDLDLLILAFYDVGVKRCHTNCSVLRTPTILSNIRIS